MNFPEIFSSDEIDLKLQEIKDKPELLLRPKPLSLTASWKAIDSNHPSIYTKLRYIWGSPECEKYLDSLIISNRDSRQGFRQEVMNALLVLSREHMRVYGSSIPHEIWNVGKDKQ